MRKSSSNDDVAPPWPPTCTSPSPPPLPKQTSDDLLASLLCWTEALTAPRTPSPEVRKLLELTKQLEAQH
eukprot:10472008-Ditylum_brightwellii.AAC.1